MSENDWTPLNGAEKTAIHIAELKAERDRYREALEDIAAIECCCDPGCSHRIARAALAPASTDGRK